MFIGLFWSRELICLALPIIIFNIILADFSHSEDKISQDLIEVNGILREKGTRTPLPEVGIYLLQEFSSTKLKTSTNSHGVFTFTNVPTHGECTLIVSLNGYYKLEQKEDCAKLTGIENKLFLEKTNYQVYETTITGKSLQKDDSTRSLKQSEFSKMPGSGGDPIKAVQNLPGVNRPSPFLAQVIIQGSAPRDTRYTVNGHEVPLIFHFAGISSVVIPEALDRVDYLAGGYGPEYGRAMGGLVGVWSKSPRKDRIHGFAYFDVLNAGGMVETPVGEKSSFMLGARKSYIGDVLGAISKGNSNFNLIAAPTFSDITTAFETELTHRDHLQILGVGSMDDLSVILNQPVSGTSTFQGNFNNQSSFFRLIPQVTHYHSPKTTSRWSLGYGRDWVKVDVGSNYSHNYNHTLSFRNELEKKVSNNWKTMVGMDHRFIWATVDFSIINTGSGVKETEENRKIATLSRHTQQLGFFWKNDIHSENSPFTWMPHMRVDYFNLTQEWIPAPRFGVKYAFTNYMSIKSTGGIYAQPPLEMEMDPLLGNPDLKSPRSGHLTLGFEKDFREGYSRGFVLTNTAFYRYFDRLVVASQNTVNRNGAVVAEIYNNNGTGRAFGLETLLRMDLKPWSGWLSYSLSRSTRFDPVRGDSLFQYDQTHLFTAIASLETGKHWTLSSRMRFVTGNPFTPVSSSIFDSDQDRFLPIRGPFYSQRLDPFFQLDLRIDKKWIYDNWILSAYLDIQNVTNNSNIESINYSYDYKTTANISGLPFLPTIGMKGEF